MLHLHHRRICICICICITDSFWSLAPALLMCKRTNSDRGPVALQLYSGGSVSGATFMNEGTADVCLNWAGAHAGCTDISILFVAS